MANLTREERLRREAEDKANNIDGSALSGDLGNPREPVFPVREDAPERLTRGSAAYPVGTKGTVVPDEATDPVIAARTRADAEAQQRMVTVRYKRGYFKQAGGEKVAIGTEEDVPITDARQLIEDGIAEYVAHLPEA